MLLIGLMRQPITGSLTIEAGNEACIRLTRVLGHRTGELQVRREHQH